MSTIKWIILSCLAVLGVIVGQRLRHERELDRERDRAEQARQMALAAGDEAAHDRARRRLADIDLALASSRQRSVLERAHEAVEDARRRAGRAAE